jgi:predicted ATP-binding protein involved in virulence
MRDGSLLTHGEVMLLLHRETSGGRGPAKDEPDWLRRFREDLRILYIPANRLGGEFGIARQRRSRIHRLMVETVAERVAEQIGGAVRTYAEMGRRLEQQFPSRIIDALRQGTRVSQQEVTTLVQDIREREARFQDLGLLSHGQTARFEETITDQSALVVLKTYLEDIQAKFRELESTAERLQVFVESINSLMLFKLLRPSLEKGFEVVSNDDRIIPLRALSSGEQHLIVLLGELIFDAPSGSIILLDEPEISFHPEWQERFPTVIEKIVKINDCLVVMATHSPTLVQDHWDAVVELAEQA